MCWKQVQWNTASNQRCSSEKHSVLEVLGEWLYQFELNDRNDQAYLRAYWKDQQQLEENCKILWNPKSLEIPIRLLHPLHQKWKSKATVSGVVWPISKWRRTVSSGMFAHW